MRSTGEMISAQPGRQTEFLRSPADICVYGGAAGGGKTVGLILEPLRHVCRVANFTAVFFRRTTPYEVPSQPRQFGVSSALLVGG